VSEPTFGPNKLHPFVIEDARAAQHRASEAQREQGERLANAHLALANAEYTYSTAKVARIKQLKEEGWAATVCAEIARGEESIAHLRRERDKRAGELEQIKDHCFTLAKDRDALAGLIRWSEGIDLRTQTEPQDWSQQPAYGTGVPAGVDPRTGELKAA
jgi:hypothetical protein